MCAATESARRSTSAGGMDAPSSPRAKYILCLTSVLALSDRVLMMSMSGYFGSRSQGLLNTRPLRLENAIVNRVPPTIVRHEVEAAEHSFRRRADVLQAFPRLLVQDIRLELHP